VENVYKISVSLIFLLTLFAAARAQGTANPEKFGGILNGKATYLPKPEYPQQAKDFCAGGKVEIRVLISEKGAVLEAEAISGDTSLRDVSVEAVKKAKFSPTHGIPVKIQGIIVYNFDSLAKCIDVGVVNKKAKFIPKPEVPKSRRGASRVVVQIVIDQSGKVTNARVISGHPLFHRAALESARAAVFYPTLINGPPILIRGLLVYKFSFGGEVSF
jgi:TonB family protein